MSDSKYLELFEGNLPVEQITNKWYDDFRLSNYGAIITFVGVVRDENNIEGLSFDIYEPKKMRLFLWLIVKVMF